MAVKKAKKVSKEKKVAKAKIASAPTEKPAPKPRRSSLPENIVLVRATPEDVRGINELLYATWLSTYPNADYGVTADDIHSRYEGALSEERLEKRAEEMRNQDKDTLAVVAKEGGKVIAFLRVERKTENRMNAIYVHPDYQGKGIGKALWKKAKAFFGPGKDIVINVVRYNAPAIAFYEKLGFKDTGVYFYDERFRMKSGANMPQMEMVLRVG